MLPLLCVAALGTPVLRADDALPSTPPAVVAPLPLPPPAILTPRERLDAALRHYLAGDHERARAALAGLLNDETVTDRTLRIRARVYLGEILFVQGDRDAAWDAFQALLADDPQHRLDPYEHPPDVVAFFETVRAAKPEGLPLRPVLPAEVPWARTRFLPFGIYQILHDRPAAGWALAAGQGVTGLASAWLIVDLASGHGTYDPDEYDRMRVKRAANWATTTTFYALWIVGWIDASGDLQRRRWSASPTALGPEADGAGLAVTFVGP